VNDRVVCDICGLSVPPHEYFVVRMDVFADPTVPAMTTEELEELDADAKFNDLLKQMEGMSADELQDGVHRRFEYKLCSGCHKQFLSNPLGLPRRKRASEN
jgi:hypothetical protein